MLQVPSWSNQSKYLRVWSHTQEHQKILLGKIRTKKIKKALNAHLCLTMSRHFRTKPVCGVCQHRNYSSRLVH